MCLPSKCLTVKKAKNEPPCWGPRAHLYSVYFGMTHSPSRGRVLLQDFLFHLGLSFVLFSHTIPPQLFPSLGSRNLFVFIFPPETKTELEKAAAWCWYKTLWTRLFRKDEYELPFLVPSSPNPLCTPSKVLPHFPSLLILSGPAVDPVSTDFHAYIMLASSLTQFLHPSPGK